MFKYFSRREIIKRDYIKRNFTHREMIIDKKTYDIFIKTNYSGRLILSDDMKKDELISLNVDVYFKNKELYNFRFSSIKLSDKVYQDTINFIKNKIIERNKIDTYIDNAIGGI